MKQYHIIFRILVISLICLLLTNCIACHKKKETEDDVHTKTDAIVHTETDAETIHTETDAVSDETATAIIVCETETYPEKTKEVTEAAVEETSPESETEETVKPAEQETTTKKKTATEKTTTKQETTKKQSASTHNCAKYGHCYYVDDVPQTTCIYCGTAFNCKREDYHLWKTKGSTEVCMVCGIDLCSYYNRHNYDHDVCIYCGYEVTKEEKEANIEEFLKLLNDYRVSLGYHTYAMHDDLYQYAQLRADESASDFPNLNHNGTSFEDWYPQVLEEEGNEIGWRVMCGGENLFAVWEDTKMSAAESLMQFILSLQEDEQHRVMMTTDYLKDKWTYESEVDVLVGISYTMQGNCYVWAVNFGMKTNLYD